MYLQCCLVQQGGLVWPSAEPESWTAALLLSGPSQWHCPPQGTREQGQGQGQGQAQEEEEWGEY